MHLNNRFVPNLFVFAAILSISIQAPPPRVLAQDLPGPASLFLPFIRNANINTANMVEIPAGPFPMGCDSAHNSSYLCLPDQLPLRSVILDAFRIDRFEVTNAAYAKCVTAGKCTLPGNPDPSYGTPHFGDPDFANYPVNYVDWYQASAYCSWAGKRLPSEAEWEKAARGITVRTFPWGDAAPTCGLANFWNEPFDIAACVGDTSPVGTYPAGASPYGVMDMAGNVTEWIQDGYQADYYQTSPSVNPPGPSSSTPYKVMRGGAWTSTNDSEPYLGTSYRSFGPATLRGRYWGFRCAASYP